MAIRSRTARNAYHHAERRRGAAFLLSLFIGLGALAATAFGQRQETGLAPQSPQPAPQAPRAGETVGEELITVDTHLVTLTVTVTDKQGHWVSGLNREAFSITDENVPQEITHFSDEDAPVSVGIVFDVSRSMSGNKMRKAREALSRFIQTSHEADEYFLIAFDSKARSLLERSRDGQAVLDTLTLVKPGGSTALYDAIYLGLSKVQTGVHRKRALLVISDGMDTTSQRSFGEVQRFLQESDAVIYSVGILDAASIQYLFLYPDLADGGGILRKLSGASGGAAFFPSTLSEMDEAFERIALELRRQYSIGYRPSNFRNDGAWHRIKVKLTPPPGQPRLLVRNRAGYFARTNPK